MAVADNSYISTGADMVSVANKIREKAGVSDGLVFPDGWIEAIEGIEAGGGTISGKKFISGEITFSETPTSKITISHDSLGFRSQPFVFLAASASAPSNNIGALISARCGSGVYVNSSKRFSLLSSISETINYYGNVNDTSFEIQSSSAKKMLAGKTYIWFRIEL